VQAQNQSLLPKRLRSRKETFRLKKLGSLEDQIHALGYERIAGVDEAGRGPLAGPVVAAACILPPGFLLRGVNDSKKLQELERERLYEELMRHPGICYAVAVVEAIEIDQINILQASLKAMRMAVERLEVAPHFLLFDGNKLPDHPLPSEGVVDGDRRCQSIAAASVIAKVTRDNIMIGYHQIYPEYRFDLHKGYGTKQHQEALRLQGICPIHRRSFGGVKEFLCEA
jgi:ribonuclease HII